MTTSKRRFKSSSPTRRRHEITNVFEHVVRDTEDNDDEIMIADGRINDGRSRKYRTKYLSTPRYHDSYV